MQTESQRNFFEMVSFSEKEKEHILCESWKLLARQAKKYTGSDSTSMPIEKAQELLESMRYTIRAGIGNGCSKEEFLQKDLMDWLQYGQEFLREKQKELRKEWQCIYQNLPKVQNVYFTETIQQLGLFLQQYEIYYAAHQIPYCLDYWLLCPVEETRRGLHYVETYLSQLRIENMVVNCFDTELIRSLYMCVFSEYTETLFNLCDPILTNAVGLALLGMEVTPLEVTSIQRETLLSYFYKKTKKEIQMLVRQAVCSVCQIEIFSIPEIEYLQRAMDGLSVRLYEAVACGDISHIFYSFVSKE